MRITLLFYAAALPVIGCAPAMATTSTSVIGVSATVVAQCTIEAAKLLAKTSPPMVDGRACKPAQRPASEPTYQPRVERLKDQGDGSVKLLVEF